MRLPRIFKRRADRIDPDAIWKEYRGVVEPSGLFDAAWYLRQYPEALNSGLHPFDHYITEGWKKGHSPGPRFDAQWYLTVYPDVAASGNEPLLHFIRHGQAEGRAPNDASYEAANASPEELPVTELLAEGREPNGAGHEAANAPPKKLPITELFAPVRLSASDATPKRILVIGSCFAEGVAHFLPATLPGCERDFILFNHAGRLPEAPPRPLEDYDFILVMPPLRTIMPEYGYVRLPYDDIEAFESFFQTSVVRLEALLDGALEYTRARSKTTFVVNFLTPQRNYLGRLLPKRDLRNPAYFCQQLNTELEKIVAKAPAAHFVDFDDLASSIGKCRLQDDSLELSNHGGSVGDGIWGSEYDLQRLEPLTPYREQFDFMMTSNEIVDCLWREVLATFKVLKQADSIKLVVTDLDDTLWRGVAVEGETISDLATEGWPLGYMEALLIVKRRGLLLGVISKNDRSSIERIWPRMCRGLIEMRDFAAIKINWSPKVKSMEEMLQEANLLPRNVLFIDDNPVERAAMAAAFPEMRVIGGNPFELRRLLLWSPETQAPSVTAESTRRTEMVQAQVLREESRKKLSREEFLATLGVRMRLVPLSGVENALFPRAFELLNRTNQFNTTGKRWSREEIVEALADGARLHVFEVEDIYVKYGLVGVIVELRGRLLQFVMSCRTVGLEAELAAVSALAERLRAEGEDVLEALIKETQSNVLSRDIWRKTGFEEVGEGLWRVESACVLAIPAHIKMEPARPPGFGTDNCKCVPKAEEFHD